MTSGTKLAQMMILFYFKDTQIVDILPTVYAYKTSTRRTSARKNISTDPDIENRDNNILLLKCFKKILFNLQFT